jgi:tetratricopeptide (TPR) repeat protein
MKLRFTFVPILILFILLIVIHPVFALKYLNTTDFKEPDVTITINNVEYKPTLSDGRFLIDEVCKKEDNVKVNYIIEPKDEYAAQEVGGESGRSITIRTELKNAIIDAIVRYASGAGVGSSSTPGQYFLNIRVAAYNAQAETSLDKIEVEVQGDMPSPSLRLEEIRVLWFDVQEAEEDCLPPVIILVIDYNQFQNDIDSLKEKYSNISAILDQYVGKVDISKLSDYLDNVFQNVSLAETYYSNGEYKKADERLKFASEWLDKADTEAKKVKAEYAYNQADKRLREIGSILDKIELYINEIEGKKLVNTSTLLNYETEFKELQRNSDDLTEELIAAKVYINNEKYSEAETKANTVLSEINDLENSANTLFDELKSIITAPEVTFQMPNIDYKLFGTVIGTIAAMATAIVGIRKYRRRRKWDELK